MYILTADYHDSDHSEFVPIFVGCLDIAADMSKWLVKQGYVTHLRYCEHDDLPDRSDDQVKRAQQFINDFAVDQRPTMFV